MRKGRRGRGKQGGEKKEGGKKGRKKEEKGKWTGREEKEGEGKKMEKKKGEGRRKEMMGVRQPKMKYKQKQFRKYFKQHSYMGGTGGWKK